MNALAGLRHFFEMPTSQEVAKTLIANQCRVKQNIATYATYLPHHRREKPAKWLLYSVITRLDESWIKSVDAMGGLI